MTRFWGDTSAFWRYYWDVSFGATLMPHPTRDAQTPQNGSPCLAKGTDMTVMTLSPRSGCSPWVPAGSPPLPPAHLCTH